MEFISHNEEDTKEFAKTIAKMVKPGEVLALKGDLGSGKTTFTKYLAEALGVVKIVTSPTFVILKRYPILNSDKFDQLVHIDCYRLSSAADLESIGFFEFLEDERNLIVVEWPESIIPILKDKVLLLEFGYLSENERIITEVE
jgi:tRNA threonylcarbamoyladenosine biosynthesis protein TsaE